jgi:hypothetical protein
VREKHCSLAEKVLLRGKVLFILFLNFDQLFFLSFMLLLLLHTTFLFQDLTLHIIFGLLILFNFQVCLFDIFVYKENVDSTLFFLLTQFFYNYTDSQLLLIQLYDTWLGAFDLTVLTRNLSLYYKLSIFLQKL